MCVCLPYQQRHEELVQVDDLDAAQTHRHLPVHLGHVAVTVGLCRSRKQGQLEAEDFVPNDGHGLQGEQERN